MAAISIIKKSELDEVQRIDAEYFMPEFLDVATHLSQSPTKNIEDFGKVVASAFYPAATSFYDDGDVPFIRTTDIIDYPIIDNSQPVAKLPADFIASSNGIVTAKANDIVISKVGTPCYAGLIDESLGEVALTRTVLGIKNIENINPLYLVAFLRSKYGFYQLMREREQQIQLQLTLDRVRNIKVFVPHKDKQDEIAEKISHYYSARKQSVSLYEKAEEILLEELGTEASDFANKLSFVVGLDDAVNVRRADAEYFQPKFQRLIEKIRAKGSKKLGEVVTVKKGFEPGSEAYQDEGKLFVRVSSLSKFGVQRSDQKYLSDELYGKLQKNYQPRVGEILLTKDATPGIAYVVKEPVEGIISGGILRLKLAADIEPEYLALCLNSLVGQMQAERDAGGSIIKHWKPEQIKNLEIPVLPKPEQTEIAKLVKQSHEARQKSKSLLDQAKRQVEELIEKQ